ncbi:SDR family NAD(P)-dependent oxidoreductase [Streptomonospora algeriensis]
MTGGTRGLGRAVVSLLADAGMNIVTCAREDHPQALAAEREAAESNGGSLVLVGADVSATEGAEALAAAGRCGLNGRVHALVNNVGGMWGAPVGGIEPAQWQRTIAADLHSAHLTTQALLPLLVDGASVVNVGSAAAMRGLAKHAPYTAAKAGLHGLTRSLARELGARGVRVNLVLPGVLAAEDALPPGAAERLRSMTALKRLGTPRDAAGVIAYLLHDRASYITGAAITCDGGI